MKTILVATDYSRAANNAMDYAAAFAQHTGSKIVLFNAFHLAVPVSSITYSKLDTQEQMAQNKTRLRKMADDIKDAYSIPVECVSITGSFREELDNVIRRFEAELVVMGVQSGSFSSSVFGITISATIRQARYPILAVPDGALFRGIDKILFACDYNSLRAMNEQTALQTLAQTFDASVQVFQVEERENAPLVSSSSSQENPGLDHLFKDIEYTYRNLEAENVLDGIAQGLHDYGADLLAIIPNKTNFMDLLLSLNNTRKVVLQTNVPMLTIPTPV